MCLVAPSSTLDPRYLLKFCQQHTHTHTQSVVSTIIHYLFCLSPWGENEGPQIFTGGTNECTIMVTQYLVRMTILLKTCLFHPQSFQSWFTKCACFPLDTMITKVTFIPYKNLVFLTIKSFCFFLKYSLLSTVIRYLTSRMRPDQFHFEDSEIIHINHLSALPSDSWSIVAQRNLHRAWVCFKCLTHFLPVGSNSFLLNRGLNSMQK